MVDPALVREETWNKSVSEGLTVIFAHCRSHLLLNAWKDIPQLLQGLSRQR